VWALVVVLVVAGGLVAWRALDGRGEQVSFRTGAVQRGDVRVQVSATGTLQAVTTVLVGSQISGTIQALYADFNDRVRTGQVLAQLDLAKNTYPPQVMTLPKILDEEVARLHLARLGVELETLSTEQADYIGVAVTGPYKPDHYRY